MESLLNFSETLDIQLLDKVVTTLYQGRGAEVRPVDSNPVLFMLTIDALQQQQAQRVISQFQEHPDAWQKVDLILETSQNFQTKVTRKYGLQLNTLILYSTLRFKFWKN